MQGLDSPAIAGPSVPGPSQMRADLEPRPSASSEAADAVGLRIRFLRLMMICGIVFIHVPDAAFENAALHVIRSIFVDGIFRFGVPVLSVMSGYLLYGSLQRKPIKKVLSAKLRTLMIPMIVWNLPFVVMLYVIESRAIGAYQFNAPAFPFSASNWFELTFGWAHQPINYPMYFIRDLMVTSALAPLFVVLATRAPILGCIAIVLFFGMDWDGNLVLRNIIPISVYCGFLIARYRVDLLAMDRFALPCLIGALCIGVLLALFPEMTWYPVLMLAPPLVWPAASLAMRMPVSHLVARHSAASFAIFVTHAPFLMLAWAVFGRTLSDAGYFVFFLIAPVGAILFGLSLYRVLYALSPWLARTVFGSR